MSSSATFNKIQRRTETLSPEIRCIHLLRGPLQRFCHRLLLEDIFRKVSPGNYDDLKLQINEHDFYNDYNLILN